MPLALLNSATMTTSQRSSKYLKLTHPPPPTSPPLPAPSSSHFDSLPDEIVLMIIKMAVESRCPPHQDYLIDVVSKVSFRFMRIAADPSLWDLYVGITFGADDEARLKDVIYGFLNEGTNYLSFWNGNLPSPSSTLSKTVVSGIYIYAVATRCPNLMGWYIKGMKMDSWPTLKAPWSSLEDLWLDGVKMKWNAFNNVDFHLNVPNLKVFIMQSCLSVPKKKPILLPDFREFKKLNVLSLVSGSFSLPTCEKVPLPSGLKTLKVLHGTIVNFDMALVEKHLPNCKIKLT